MRDAPSWVDIRPMGYKLVDIELSEDLRPIGLSAKEDGIGLLARWQGRPVGFRMIDLSPGATMSVDALEALADECFAGRALAARLEAEVRGPPDDKTPLPSLTVAICTRDRAERLGRLLASLDRVRATSPFPSVEIVVVDNAPPDDSTEKAVEAFADVRYEREPKAGLDFARNAALHAAKGDLVAYLDDDVVVDRNWLRGLAGACRDAPDAGGFTGLVLPFRLDTEAQVLFERHGGFGRGFARREFRGARFDNPLHPVGAGILGAGCNMAFRRSLLMELGGFDEALDTGAPLPGGGDLDMFYRVLRSGRTMVYEPEYAVRHEHRETVPQLRRQYWTWGLGMMAFLVKSYRTDRELRPRHRAMVRWWFLDQSKALLRAAGGFRGRDLRFRAAELAGGICGLAGEYDRSRARVNAIRERQT